MEFDLLTLDFCRHGLRFIDFSLFHFLQSGAVLIAKNHEKNYPKPGRNDEKIVPENNYLFDIVFFVFGTQFCVPGQVLGSFFAPKTSQNEPWDPPKRSQDACKTPQNLSKMRRIRFETAQEPPKTPKTPPRAPKTPPNCPKTLPRPSTTRFLEVLGGF